MESPQIAILIKMMESLPEEEQNQVVEAFRAYIADLQDEVRWENSYKQTQDKLIKTAHRARRQIREKSSQPLDLSRL
jgi:hypothetical protein